MAPVTRVQIPSVTPKGLLMQYEFQCKKCGHVFEEQRKLKDNSDVSTCPECNNEAEKIASDFGFKVNGYSSLNGYSSANVKR